MATARLEFFIFPISIPQASIPVAAARKIEWLIKKNNLDVDLRLIPILLDHDQCVHYRLPRTPIKEGEGRSDEWAIRFGEGGTELDALEALHPGELHRIVTEVLDRYHDHDLQGRWNALLIERRRAISAIAQMSGVNMPPLSGRIRPSGTVWLGRQTTFARKRGWFLRK